MDIQMRTLLFSVFCNHFLVNVTFTAASLAPVAVKWSSKSWQGEFCVLPAPWTHRHGDQGKTQILQLLVENHTSSLKGLNNPAIDVAFIMLVRT
jgi:hypothetical protein